MHEDYVATGGHGLDEQVNDIESLLGTDLLAPTIWEQLEQVSKRKRLKNLDRFYTNKEIVLQAIEITIKGKKTKSVKIQFIAKNTVGKPQLYKTNTGCFEICQAIKKWWVDGNHTISYPQYVTVGKENTSYYFKEYHITNDQACKQITQDLNIDIDKL